MKIFGFAGTAKNTGKTTTALAVLEQSRLAGFKNAITSIGYDGESLDHITGLPKPRYQLLPGELIATARECLEDSPARCKVLLETNIETVLGTILIAEVQEAGLVLLAGPNRESDLRFVLQEFATLGVEFAIVDGALNRIVPLICTDGLIFSTGAAFKQKAAQIAVHAAAIECIFRLPQAETTLSRGEIVIRYKNGTTNTLPGGSLISSDTIKQLGSLLTKSCTDITIPGACQPKLLAEIIPAIPDGTNIHLGSPLKMIASGDALFWTHILSLANGKNIIIDMLETLPLLLFTINPFYTQYLQKNGIYQAAYIDAKHLLEIMRENVHHTPVFDTMQPIESTIKSWFELNFPQ